jgi:hypothetical protein
MSLTNTYEDHLLKYLLSATALTRPTTWYVALFTAAPGETGGGTEVTGGSYARQVIAFTFSGTSPTQAANTSQIDFPTATANWGTITHAAIFDAVSGGNMLWYGALASSKVINTGDIFRFAAGALVLTLD